MAFNGAKFQELKPRRATYDEMINSGRLYNLSKDTLVDEIIDYYKNVEDDIYQIHVNRDEFRNVFYSTELSSFWYWHFEANSFKHARDFFNNQNNKAYEILKQSAGWSIIIVKNNTLLLQQNRALKEIINNELQLLD